MLHERPPGTTLVVQPLGSQGLAPEHLQCLEAFLQQQNAPDNAATTSNNYLAIRSYNQCQAAAPPYAAATTTNPTPRRRGEACLFLRILGCLQRVLWRLLSCFCCRDCPELHDESIILPGPPRILPGPPRILPGPPRILPDPPRILPNPPRILPGPPRIIPRPSGILPVVGVLGPAESAPSRALLKFFPTWLPQPLQALHQNHAALTRNPGHPSDVGNRIVSAHVLWKALYTREEHGNPGGRCDLAAFTRTALPELPSFLNEKRRRQY